MTDKEALKLALSCIRSSVEYKRGNASFIEAAEDVEQALAAPVQEPVADGLIRQYITALVANKPDEAANATKGMVDYVYTTPPAAPDLQAELDATNRQVEILSDALAESRREVDALVAVARADEREACWRLCDALWIEEGKDAQDCREAIRARGNA
jgi:hypothetical protein